MSAWLRGELAAAVSCVLVFGVPFVVCVFAYLVARWEGERAQNR